MTGAHWLTRYDSDGDPYETECRCPIGDDHAEPGPENVTDYRWWITEEQVPANWLEAVKLSMHSGGPDGECLCESGDEHAFIVDGLSDDAVHAMFALAPLVAQAEQARVTAEIVTRLRAVESWEDFHALVKSLASPRCSTCQDTGKVLDVASDGESASEQACPACDTPYPAEPSGSDEDPWATAEAPY